jgi:hypothetical protein
MSDNNRRRFYGQKRTIYKRGPPKPTQPQQTKRNYEESFYFISGSAIEWIQAKRKLEGAFREADVWDLVDIPIGIVPIITLDVNGNPGPALLPEVMHTLPVPDYNIMVNQALQQFIDNIHQTYGDNIDLVNNSLSLSDLQKDAKILNLSIRRNEDLSKVDNYNMQLENTYNSRREQYEKSKEKFESKKAKCIGIFRKRIAPNALTIANGHLYAERFRQSWHCLNEFYKSTSAGREGRSAVIHLLQNEVWDGKDLQGHIDYMSCLHSQCVEYGTANTDDYKYECLSNSIIKSNNCPRSLREVINHFSISPVLYTYNQLLETLQMKASVLKLDQQTSMQKNRSNDRRTEGQERVNSAKRNNDSNKRTVTEYESRVNTSSVNYNDNNNNRNNYNDNNNNRNNNNNNNKYINKKDRSHLKCDHCKKTGHTKEQCWAIHACEICGEIGHPGYRCSQRNMDDEEVHTSFPSNKKLKGSHKEVALVENFTKKYPHKP